MSTIDYLLKTATEAAAIADPVIGAYNVSGAWRQDICVTGMQFWDKGSDVAGVDGFGNPTVTHTFLPGFFLLIALPAHDAGLDAHANLILSVDWDAKAAGAPIGIWLTHPGITIPNLLTKRFQPVFAGRGYNFGQAW